MTDPQTLADHKDKARALLQASAAHDGPAFAALMHPDAIWWTLGKPHLFDHCGEKTRDEICAYMATPSIFNGGVEVQFGALTAEDDRVVIFTTVTGKLRDGRQYRNNIAFQFTIADGKIVHVIEAPDSAKSRAFWLGK